MLEKMREFVAEEDLKKGDKTLDNGYFDDGLLKYAEDNDINKYLDTSSVKELYENVPKNRRKMLWLGNMMKKKMFIIVRQEKQLKEKVSFIMSMMLL